MYMAQLQSPYLLVEGDEITEMDRKLAKREYI